MRLLLCVVTCSDAHVNLAQKAFFFVSCFFLFGQTTTRQTHRRPGRQTQIKRKSKHKRMVFEGVIDLTYVLERRDLKLVQSLSTVEIVKLTNILEHGDSKRVQSLTTVDQDLVQWMNTIQLRTKDTMVYIFDRLLQRLVEVFRTRSTE